MLTMNSTQSQMLTKERVQSLHLYGVSLAATMIAKKRKLDPELLSMASTLHDPHAYRICSRLTEHCRIKT